jgi:hypothetical protein
MVADMGHEVRQLRNIRVIMSANFNSGDLILYPRLTVGLLCEIFVSEIMNDASENWFRTQCLIYAQGGDPNPSRYGAAMLVTQSAPRRLYAASVEAAGNGRWTFARSIESFYNTYAFDHGSSHPAIGAEWARFKKLGYRPDVDAESLDAIAAALAADYIDIAEEIARAK